MGACKSRRDPTTTSESLHSRADVRGGVSVGPGKGVGMGVRVGQLAGLGLLLGLFFFFASGHLGVLAPAPTTAVVWASSLAADNDEEEDEQSLDAFVDEMADLSNTFWAARLREIGKPYRAPKIVKARATQRITSQCGNSRGSEHSYCGTDETVFFDWDSDEETSFETLWDDDRSLVIVTTVAHEWGHHVQQLLGIFDIDDRSVQVENQADCLMGIFIASYEKSSDWVTRADMRDAIEDTRDAGDDPETPLVERTHGTPDERVEAFMRGYQGKTLANCGI